MKNAIKYGIIIGALSGCWIVLMHLGGLFESHPRGLQYITWMEYFSVLIPFGGLYVGLKRYRKTHLKNRMSLFQGMMQGFKILLVGAVLYMATLSVYFKYVQSNLSEIDYMQRISALGVVGILLVLVVSLMLMTRPRHL